MRDSPDSQLDALRPERSVFERVRRVLLLVLGLVVLAWAWDRSGMNDVGLLWQNRERAVNYIFGQPVDASTYAERYDEAERAVRTQFQTEALTEIRARYAERDEAEPSLLAMMRESEDLARQRITALPESRFDELVLDRMQGMGEPGQRRGGYFPPETSPVAIFGDPQRTTSITPSMRWLANMADRMGEPLRMPVRWVVVALGGEGYTGKLVETIAIALWGTVLSVVISIPGSLFGATLSLRILAPGEGVAHRLMRWVGKFVVRRSFDIARGFNEIVLAMIFVAVLGLGPLPGVLALLIHTYGVLGKVFSEAIETVDIKQVEGVESTGAGPTQVIAYAVLPQIMPYVVSQSLLRFESNVRGATILGVVGAGGIGQMLMDKFGAFEYQEVATMMIIIIVVVTLIDFGCSALMRRLV